MALLVLTPCMLVRELAGSVYAKDRRKGSPQNVGNCVLHRALSKPRTLEPKYINITLTHYLHTPTGCNFIKKNCIVS
jgi:hypothetical protein